MSKISKPRKLGIALVLMLMVGTLIHRFLYFTETWQTAAMFIGLPTIIAIVIVRYANPKTPIEVVTIGTGLFLSASGILLAEGFICILMAFPIFLIVAITVTWIILNIKRAVTTRFRRLNVCALPVIGIMALEGVLPHLNFPRENVLTREVIAAVPANIVAERMQSGFPMKADLPFFLRLGFPPPVDWKWNGDRVEVRFDGPPHFENVLVLERTTLTEHSASFRFVEDRTPMPRWLDWKDAHVKWTENADGTTTIYWTVTYNRSLDPAWYFHPLERYGVGVAVRYLAESLGEP